MREENEVDNLKGERRGMASDLDTPPRLRATLHGWLLLSCAALLTLTPAATAASWLGALGRFGLLEALGHALEHTFLPLSWTLARLFALVTVLGVAGQALVSRLAGRRAAALTPLPAAALMALLTYLAFCFVAGDPDWNDFYYANPDVVWTTASSLQTVFFVLLGLAAGAGAWLYFGRSWSRRLTATPWRRKGLGTAAALYAAAVAVALAAPYLASRGDTARPNVLLISMDTLRADHLGVYGYGRDTSPHIDALSERGVVFERAVSQAPWTLPAHMSLFTGLYPSEHGLTEFSQDETTWRPLPEAVPLLAEVLAREGWLTGAFTGGGFVGPAFGFDRGFDLYRTDSRRLEDFHPAVLRWLGRSAHRPFFLFLHFYNTHRPYAPPEPENGRYAGPGAGGESAVGFCAEAERTGTVPSAERLAYVVSQYDGEIRFADRLLGEVLARLAELDLERRTLIVFLSDHGEEFFEHGGCDHLKSLYEPLVQVPLLVAGPGLAAGRRVTEPVELRDVGQLILDALGIERRLGRDPRRLLPLLRRGLALPEGATAYSETCCKGYEVRGGGWFLKPFSDGIRALSSRRYKLVTDELARPVEFYDLESDPGEQRDLLAHGELGDEHSSVLAALAAEMATRRAAIMEGRELVRRLADGEGDRGLDDETREQLRALGYVD